MTRIVFLYLAYANIEGMAWKAERESKSRDGQLQVCRYLHIREIVPDQNVWHYYTPLTGSFMRVTTTIHFCLPSSYILHHP